MDVSKKQEYIWFESVEEITGYPGYLPENPLTQENYSEILGWYQLPVRQACCVERANGSLCHQLHLNGWVARKSNGSVTIMGRDCANDKFNADSSVFEDMALANNARVERERERRLLDLASRAENYQTQLSVTIRKLKTEHRKLQDFLDDVGREFRTRVENMARTGNSTVIVEGTKFRHYEEGGRAKREVSTVRHPLGNLVGLSAVDSRQIQALVVEMEEIRVAFNKAAELPKLNRKQKNEVGSRLEQCDPALTRAERLLETISQFMGNSPWLYCFLTGERSERSRVARMAMNAAGVHGGREQAKAWLTDRERDLASDIGVEKIQLSR